MARPRWSAATTTVHVRTFRGLLLLTLIAVSVFAASREAFTSSCALAQAQDRPFGCFEWWLNRYQTLFGALVTAGVALWAGSQVLHQVRLMRQSLLAQGLPITRKQKKAARRLWTLVIDLDQLLIDIKYMKRDMSRDEIMDRIDKIIISIAPLARTIKSFRFDDRSEKILSLLTDVQRELTRIWYRLYLSHEYIFGYDDWLTHHGDLDRIDATSAELRVHCAALEELIRKRSWSIEEATF